MTGVSAVPPLIVFGFLLALLYEKTGSIIPGILLHMLNNSVALLGQSARRRRVDAARIPARDPPPRPRAGSCRAPGGARRAAAAAPRRRRAPVPTATVKIRVGHLHGGKAPIYGTVPVSGSIAPFVPGQNVDVTFYLDSHKLLISERRASSKGGGEAGTFGPASSSARTASTRPAPPTPRPRRSAATPPCARAGRSASPRCTRVECGKVVEGFKGALAKMGYVSGGGSCFNGRLGREVLAYRKVNGMARDRAGRRGARQDGLRRQRRLPRPLPRRRRARRGAARQAGPRPRQGRASPSRSTRSRPASPRPRRSPATTTSTCARPATTRRACTTPSTGTTATPSTATRKSPTTPPATAVSAPSSPTSPASTTSCTTARASSSSDVVAVPDLDAAKRTLLAELREHSLVIGEVTLSSGAEAQYYVDARRTLLRAGRLPRRRRADRRRRDRAPARPRSAAR